MTGRGRRGAGLLDRERGSVSLELAILGPALILLLGALILVGRVEIAAGAVEQATRIAARDASLARTADAARAAATVAGTRELTAAGVTCSPLTVVVDVAGFNVPLGQPAAVRVEITCTAPLADLAVPGLPGARTLTGQSVSPLDRYRSR